MKHMFKGITVTMILFGGCSLSAWSPFSKSSLDTKRDTIENSAQNFILAQLDSRKRTSDATVRQGLKNIYAKMQIELDKQRKITNYVVSHFYSFIYNPSSFKNNGSTVTPTYVFYKLDYDKKGAIS